MPESAAPTRSPSGGQFALSHGHYAATVTEVGATLRELTHAGRALVAGFRADEAMPLYHGAILAPWPGRIGDGRYVFDGIEHQLPLSEPARAVALHGLVAWQPWTVEGRSSSSVQLGTTLYPQRGYPFVLTLTARYALDDDGLTITVTARNDGATDAPYGISIHPWLTVGPGPVDTWRLRVPAERVLVPDDRLLPVGLAPAEGRLDLASAAPIGARRLDHIFTVPADAVRVASLVGDEGRGLELAWGPECAWVQVCTADGLGAGLDRRVVAIEPMTCPSDAFRTGEGVVRLVPGGSHRTWWRIAAVG